MKWNGTKLKGDEGIEFLQKIQPTQEFQLRFRQNFVQKMVIWGEKSKWNKAKRHFVLKKELFSVYILPTTHFEWILNETLESLLQNQKIFYKK
jgi:hypothetical protein